MHPFRSALILLAIAVLAACTAPTPIPPTAAITTALIATHKPTSTVPPPTSAPSLTPTSPTATLPRPTRPPAAAAIIFTTDACQYDGPPTLPVSELLIVNLRIKTQGGDVYALTPFLTDEPWSREDLLAALEGLDIHRPALPSGLTSLGTTLALAGANMNLNLKSGAGPMQGLLYFSCWAAGRAYEILGPIELK